MQKPTCFEEQRNPFIERMTSSGVDLHTAYELIDQILQYVEYYMDVGENLTIYSSSLPFAAIALTKTLDTPEQTEYEYYFFHLA